MANKSLSCPHCGGKKLVKSGFVYTSAGKRQRYLCMNKKRCRKHTTKPRRAD